MNRITSFSGAVDIICPKCGVGQRCYLSVGQEVPERYICPESDCHFGFDINPNDFLKMFSPINETIYKKPHDRFLRELTQKMKWLRFYLSDRERDDGLKVYDENGKCVICKTIKDNHYERCPIYALERARSVLRDAGRES